MAELPLEQPRSDQARVTYTTPCHPYDPRRTGGTNTVKRSAPVPFDVGAACKNLRPEDGAGRDTLLDKLSELVKTASRLLTQLVFCGLINATSQRSCLHEVREIPHSGGPLLDQMRRIIVPVPLTVPPSLSWSGTWRRLMEVIHQCRSTSLL